MTFKPFLIAVVTTEYHKNSHADVIVSRWLEPRPTDALYGWTEPKTQIASFYVEQRVDGRDMSARLSEQFHVPRFPTVREALSLGGASLAVDAVLLIGEHGDYPVNEFHQKLYPRKRLFDEIVAVFRESGRTVPVFFDKHFSWNAEWIREMYECIQRERVPFFGGSSTPYSPCIPALELSDAPECEEVVAIYYNALEPYLFHSLEWVQSIIERRPGGETGVREIVAWKDDDLWNALDCGEFSWDLLVAAACRVPPAGEAAIRELRANRAHAVYAFQLRYLDGLKVTHFMVTDVIKKWCLAVREASGRIQSARLGTEGEEHFFPHFARFCCQIEAFFLTGKAPISPERLYVTSMATALCMHALAQEGKPLVTPELARPFPK